MRVFDEKGVTELSPFFSLTEWEGLRRHLDVKAHRGQLRSMGGDGQIAGAPCEYGDPFAERLLFAKTAELCDRLELDLVPSYSYVRLCRPGDRLPPHRDRPACEITVTASLDPDSRWPLSILVAEGVADYCPPCRGAVVFKGVELLHWRAPLSGERPVATVSLHYVQREGRFASWAYDRRPRVPGMPGEDAPCS